MVPFFVSHLLCDQKLHNLRGIINVNEKLSTTTAAVSTPMGIKVWSPHALYVAHLNHLYALSATVY